MREHDAVRLTGIEQAVGQESAHQLGQFGEVVVGHGVGPKAPERDLADVRGGG